MEVESLKLTAQIIDCNWDVAFVKLENQASYSLDSVDTLLSWSAIMPYTCPYFFIAISRYEGYELVVTQ